MKYITNVWSLQPRTKIYKNTYKQIEEFNSITQRLYLQIYRRPSSLMINLIQPLLWLILFGALFQNAPIHLFTGENMKYKEFLNPGIIIFTAFNNSINAGLPVIFDREFGFLNRILVSPLINKKSLIYSCITHTWIITNIQIIIITIFSSYQTKTELKLNQLLLIISISTLVIISISSLSICNAFILPGHIEFIALTTLFINLPTLFASTALAPLSFMPYWLQIIVCINPLTYAVEIIRQNNLHQQILFNKNIISTIWFNVGFKESIFILIFINIISFILVNKIIKYKYD
uniref:ABC transmembrane type-2 domain-containing protein n=1 Tax=Chondria tumulosa TaxID=2740715 RepID=A0A896SQ24_9FLOR|nr:hypothetical protein K8K75_pgp035 [Chondria tumulosa]QSD57172.1 hypothetical protein [Chondria tumulosa]